MIVAITAAAVGILATDPYLFERNGRQFTRFDVRVDRTPAATRPIIIPIERTREDRDRLLRAGDVIAVDGALSSAKPSPGLRGSMRLDLL